MESEDCARRSLPTLCNQSTKAVAADWHQACMGMALHGITGRAKTMTTTNSGSIPPQQRVSATNLAPPNETRRPVGVRRWAARIARFLLPAGLFAISLFGVVDSPAHAAAPAQPTPHSKLARDLQAGIDAGNTQQVNWARDVKD